MFKNMSLKLKLMGLLVLLSSSILAIYSTIALKDFEKDKIAYVLDTNLKNSQSTALQIRSESENIIEKIEFYLRAYRPETGFHPYAKKVFPGDKNIDLLSILQESVEGEVQIQSQLQKENVATDLLDKFNKLSKLQFVESTQSANSFSVLNENSSMWLLSIKLENDELTTPLVAVALVNKGLFMEALRKPGIQGTYFLNAKNEPIGQPLNADYEISNRSLHYVIQNSAKLLTTSSLVNDTRDQFGKSWLVSISKTGLGQTKVMALVPREKALKAVSILKYKSVLFVLFLIGVTTFISVLGSANLTSKLKELVALTKKVSTGDFDVKAQAESQDEVGQLGESFNQMTGEIRRLISETAEKARMESELQTAKTVQSNLFPEMSLSDPTFDIRGFYEPASECSGDWFYYNKIGSKVYLWIGDATGHGVPAALVTSAAKSACGVLNHFPNLPLSDVMALFNKAIYGTSHGKVMMTFFLGCYNEETMELEYCNASHDPPFLIVDKGDEPIKKRDIQVLIGETGNRLGQDPSSQYDAVKVQLKENDRIVFYTDGVTELLNSEGKMLGERDFVRGLIKSYNDDKDIDLAMMAISQQIKEHRKEHQLADDCTFFVFQVKSKTAEPQSA